MTCLSLLEKDLSRDQEPWNTYAGEAYVAEPGARRTPLDGGMEKIYLHRLYHALGKIYTENKKIFYFFCFFSDTHSQVAYGCPLTQPLMRGKPMRFWDFRRSGAYSGPRGYHLTAYRRASKIRTSSEDMNTCSYVHKNTCSDLRKYYPVSSIYEHQFYLAHPWPQTSTS